MTSQPRKDAAISLPLLIVVGLTREGEIAARRGRVAIGATGLSRAMAEGRPSAILSFGLCGALDPALGVGDLLIADGVVTDRERYSTDAAWAADLRDALPHALRGDMACGDVIVATPAEKAALFRATGAAAVDMESHAAARIAAEAGVPFAVVRAVSDGAARALPQAAKAGFGEGGEPDVGAVILALARRPWELPALIRVGFEAEAGFKALARAIDRIAWPRERPVDPIRPIPPVLSEPSGRWDSWP